MPIVIAQHDPAIATRVADELRPHFSQIEVVSTPVELNEAITHHQARVAVLDLELIELDEVQRLAQKFANLRIVCTHRSPDEQKWIAALNAGAVEFCHPADVRLITRASRKIPQRPLRHCA